MPILELPDNGVIIADSDGCLTVKFGGAIPGEPYLVKGLTCFMEPRTLFRVKPVGNEAIKSDRVYVASKGRFI